MLHRRALLIAAAALSVAGAAAAAPQIGAPAPDFQAMDAEGHAHALKDLAGKVVVLEWISSDCPYTAKHYNSGTMQRLQKVARKQGVVWLTVSSAASGRADYFTAPAALAWLGRVMSAEIGRAHV